MTLRRVGGQGVNIFSYTLPKKGHQNHQPAPTTKRSNRATNKALPFPPQGIKSTGGTLKTAGTLHKRIDKVLINRFLGR